MPSKREGRVRYRLVSGLVPNCKLTLVVGGAATVAVHELALAAHIRGKTWFGSPRRQLALPSRVKGRSIVLLNCPDDFRPYAQSWALRSATVLAPHRLHPVPGRLVHGFLTASVLAPWAPNLVVGYGNTAPPADLQRLADKLQCAVVVARPELSPDDEALGLAHHVHGATILQATHERVQVEGEVVDAVRVRTLADYGGSGGAFVARLGRRVEKDLSTGTSRALRSSVRKIERLAHQEAVL